MSRQRLADRPDGQILLTGNRPAAGATARIFAHNTLTPVPVYQTETGASQLTQPLIADTNGLLPGWIAAEQRVDIAASITIAGATYSQTGSDDPIVPTDMLAGPIASLQDPQWAAVGDGQYTPGSGTGGTMSGTDDTTAIKNALWSLSPTGGTLLLGPTTYYVNGPPDTTGLGNASIPLPTFGQTASSLAAIGANIAMDVPTLRIVGVPGLTRIICPRTDAYSSAHGPYSILGGPTKEGTGQSGSGFGSLPARVQMSGVTFIGPDQPVGGAVDLGLLSSARVDNTRLFTLTTLNFETAGNAPANLPGIASFGVRMPIGGGMESRSLLRDSIINGWGTFVVVNNHTVITDVVTNFGRAMLGIDDTVGRNAPSATIHYMWATGTNYWIAGWDPQNGVKSLTTATNSNPASVYGMLGQDPWTGAFAAASVLLDANNLIAGDIRTYGWANALAYSPNPSISGKGARLTSRPLDQSGTSGTATLTAGTVTITASQVTAGTNIEVGIRAPAGTPGAVYVSAVTAGTGFTVKSTSGTDTSLVWWRLGNQY